jgi:alpha-tubulin suppressor-like RCC1 family protein
LALDEDGFVWVWGSNDRGQLGTGDGESRTSPTRLDLAARVVAIDAGGAYSLALDQNGQLWGWGENRGQLGNGAMEDSATPTPILTGVARPIGD